MEDVGTVTNRATAIESYKAKFPYGSKEWLELDYRVQACIAISQSSIDCAKGIKIEYGFPKSWISHKVNTITENDSEEVIKKVEKNLDYPVIVKPATLGSSVGISSADNKQELIMRNLDSQL